MTDRFMARLSGVLVLLSMGTEIASIALAASHGSADSMNAMNWGVGDELVFFQAPWMTRWFPLAILAPAFAMLAFPAMYSVLARGGSAAFCGVIASSFGLVLGVLGEMIRLSMAVTLPARYLAASEVARPAVLALGAFLNRLFLVLIQGNFVLTFAVGTPLVALAIIRGRTLPRWFGWVLLIPSVLVGYVGGPLLVPEISRIADLSISIGLDIFFVWFIVLGVVLLRWRPTRDGVGDLVIQG